MGEQPILGVDDLLGRYRAEGEQDSSGSFTLDPKKALERLAKFQLPTPYHWILKVFQCLHLSGARNVRVDAGINKVDILADAAPLGFASMEDLLAQLLADAADSTLSLRHLAAGLQGTLAVQPSQISLAIVRNSEKRSYLLKAGGWRDGLREYVGGSGDSFELKLVRSLSEKLGSSWFLLNTDIFDLLFRRKEALDREYKVIDAYCNYSRCQITAGTRNTNDCSFGRPRFIGYDIRRDRDPGKSRPPVLQAMYQRNLIAGSAHAQHHLAEFVVPSEEPGGFVLEGDSYATLTNRIVPEIRTAGEKNGLSRAYAIRMEMSEMTKVVFWEDGVMLGRKTVPTGVPGLVALVDARHLRKDLTTLQVLEDNALAALLEEIKLAGEKLRSQILENLHLMPAPDYLQNHLGTG
ncbi:MAG: hypothetical protein WC314_05090 [Vulcanimicrobiota bacterium]